jgi:hypothetical protein
MPERGVAHPAAAQDGKRAAHADAVGTADESGDERGGKKSDHDGGIALLDGAAAPPSEAIFMKFFIGKRGFACT